MAIEDRDHQASRSFFQEERYQAFIKNSSEGIWLCELDQPIPTSLSPKKQIELIYKNGYISEANDAMAEMYGLDDASQLVGARLSALFVKDDPQNTEYLLAFIQSSYKLSGAMSHEKDREGGDKYFRNSLTGIVQDGKLLRAWGTQQDVTEQTHTMKALQRSEERLAQAIEASHLGLWEWTIEDDILEWSDQLKEIYGLTSSETVTYERYLSLIHPEDRDRMLLIIRRANASHQSYAIEHRIVRPDGSEHWVMGRGKTLYQGDKPVRMIGTAMLIDDQKENERYIRESERLEAANALLMVQHQELTLLNKSKDEFISLASHQLRTPATGVKQYIGLVVEGFAGELSPMQTDYLRIAYESNERQLRIVDDLLRVAHVDAGKVVLRRTKTNIVTLVNDILGELEGTLEGRGQTVKVITKADSIIAKIDPDRLRMVIENIIDNASKYTHHGKQITITLEQNETNCLIHIKDQGVGIAAEDIGKLFHKFSRIDNDLSTKVGGTGIGLYWAQRIIDLHGGTIDVTSQLGKGTTFTLTIPRSVA